MQPASRRRHGSRVPGVRGASRIVTRPSWRESAAAVSTGRCGTLAVGLSGSVVAVRGEAVPSGAGPRRGWRTLPGGSGARGFRQEHMLHRRSYRLGRRSVRVGHTRVATSDGRGSASGRTDRNQHAFVRWMPSVSRVDLPRDVSQPSGCAHARAHGCGDRLSPRGGAGRQVTRQVFSRFVAPSGVRRSATGVRGGEAQESHGPHRSGHRRCGDGPFHGSRPRGRRRVDPRWNGEEAGRVRAGRCGVGKALEGSALVRRCRRGRMDDFGALKIQRTPGSVAGCNMPDGRREEEDVEAGIEPRGRNRMSRLAASTRASASADGEWTLWGDADGGETGRLAGSRVRAPAGVDGWRSCERGPETAGDTV